MRLALILFMLLMLSSIVLLAHLLEKQHRYISMHAYNPAAPPIR